MFIHTAHIQNTIMVTFITLKSILSELFEDNDASIVYSASGEDDASTDVSAVAQ